MKHEVVDLRNVMLAYRHSVVLQNLNVTLYQEDITFLTGASGCGKSVLAKVIAGKLQPDAGNVYHMGQQDRKNRLHASDVQYVGRDAALVGTLSVAENLCLPWLAGKMGIRYAKKVRVLAQSLFETYGVTLDLNQNVRNLSQLQMLIVYCVCAMHRKMRLVIFDDVLQPLTREEHIVFFSWVEHLHVSGCCVLISDMWRDCGCANRVLLLENGTIAADLSPERYYKQQAVLFEKQEETQNYSGRQIASVQKQEQSVLHLPLACGVREIRLSESGVTGVCITPAKAYRALFEHVLKEDVLQKYNAGIAVLRPEAFQTGFFPNLSVAENLLMPALRRIADGGMLLPKSKQRFIVEEWGDYISIDRGRWREPMRHFGRQQIQEVLLYRLLAKGASRIVLVGLLDEADPLLHEKVLQFIRVAKLHRRQVVVIGQNKRALNDIHWVDIS